MQTISKISPEFVSLSHVIILNKTCLQKDNYPHKSCNQDLNHDFHVVVNHFYIRKVDILEDKIGIHYLLTDLSRRWEFDSTELHGQ